jgi:DNA primase
MSFDRSKLPKAVAYFENAGFPLKGSANAKWKTTACPFHGGSDSLRVNLASGGWICMSCYEKGGDVLAFHMRLHKLEFASAAKALGVELHPIVSH